MPCSAFRSPPSPAAWPFGSCHRIRLPALSAGEEMGKDPSGAKSLLVVSFETISEQSGRENNLADTSSCSPVEVKDIADKDKALP